METLKSGKFWIGFVAAFLLLTFLPQVNILSSAGSSPFGSRRGQ